jgi:hypothetical protein
MLRMKPLRNDKLSLFHSAVADVLSRERLGATTPGVPGNAALAAPGLADPRASAASALCELVHKGQPIPDEPPAEVAGSSETAATVWKCMNLTLKLFLAKLEHRRDTADQLEREYKDSACDPGFLEAFEAYEAYFGPLGSKQLIPYIRHSALGDFVLDTLPPNATVALIGDWGTGTKEARDVLQQVARKNPDVVIHLGDIYYSGTERETQENFLQVCNEVFDRKGGRPAIYTMSGNHDMYSGGVAYYNLLKQLNPAPAFAVEQAQPASYFCLRSPGAWQFLAMDTGLHDHDPFHVLDAAPYLEAAETDWHLDKINAFHQAGGRTILLSHHQLFSAYEPIGKLSGVTPEEAAFNQNLLASFREVLQDGKIAAWFWGHEHNLCIYEPFGSLNKGRCVGHGAIPVFGLDQPYRQLPQRRNPQLVVDPVRKTPIELGLNADGVYSHGYVMIYLDDKRQRADVLYYQENDEKNPLYQETLP